jgi:sugar phosphate isomerase/epimerase
MSKHSRRSFLQHTALASAGAAWAATCPSAATHLFAADKPAGLKYSMCNETFVDWPQDKIFQFIGQCGYGAVEIAPFTINTDVTQISARQRKQLRRQAEAAGIRVIGLHWLLAKTKGLHLTSPDPAVRDKTAEYVAELAKFCSDLGGDVMVFGSPKQRNLLEGVSRGQALGFATEVLRKAMPTLAERQVLLALEPLTTKETDFMNTAAEGVELAKLVDSPQCKLLLDCKAMTAESTSIPDLIRKHGEWLIHFHANDPNLRGPGMGDLDFVPIFQALKDVEFKGWVSVEVFDYTPGAETLARESIEYMKKVEAKVFG